MDPDRGWRWKWALRWNAVKEFSLTLEQSALEGNSHAFLRSRNTFSKSSDSSLELASLSHACESSRWWLDGARKLQSLKDETADYSKRHEGGVLYEDNTRQTKETEAGLPPPQSQGSRRMKETNFPHREGTARLCVWKQLDGVTCTKDGQRVLSEAGCHAIGLSSKHTGDWGRSRQAGREPACFVVRPHLEKNKY